MATVYGDSTPFPYGADFIETIRHAVDCGVQLLQAQYTITGAVDRGGTVEQQRHGDRARLDALSDAIHLTLQAYQGSSSSERLVRAANEVLRATQAAIEREIASLEGQATGEMSSAREVIAGGRAAAFRAVEAFILRHDLPNTDVGLRLAAVEVGYGGEVLVAAPFGVEAVFDLAIPAAHEWGKARRVGELAGGIAIHAPKEAGWISKRMELQPAKLDRYFLSEVTIAQGHGALALRKAPRSGSGFLLELDETEGHLVAGLRSISEDGVTSQGDALRLPDDETATVGHLWKRVIDSTRDLASRRQSMKDGTFDGEPIREHDEPRAICERMIMVLTPIVQEISARSGAPGELVLRRDAGEGRREEVYVTKAELFEKIRVLPEHLRRMFDGFELAHAPLSPRAPMPSEEIILSALEEQPEVTVADGKLPKGMVRTPPAFAPRGGGKV